MTILDKYILKQILVGFALVLISMTVLAATNGNLLPI